MRPVKDRQHLAASREIGDLRIGAREVTLQVQLLAVALDQERDVARHEPRGTMADEQAEIVPLNVLDQYLRARFGKGWGQVNHAIVSRCRASTASAHMRDQRSNEQDRPGQQKNGPRGSVDPLQMTRVEGTEQRSEPEGER